LYSIKIKKNYKENGSKKGRSKNFNDK
jgi:hypothetical protein